MRIPSDLKIEKIAAAYAEKEVFTPEEDAMRAELDVRHARLQVRINKARGDCPGHPHCLCTLNAKLQELVLIATPLADEINAIYAARYKRMKVVKSDWIFRLSRARALKLSYVKPD